MALHSSLLLLALPALKDVASSPASAMPTSVESYTISLQDETFLSHSDQERSHGPVPGRAVEKPAGTSAPQPSTTRQAASSAAAQPEQMNRGGDPAPKGDGGPAGQAMGGSRPGAGMVPASGLVPDGPSGIVSEWEAAPATGTHFVPTGNATRPGGIPGALRTGGANPGMGNSPSGTTPGIPRGVPGGTGRSITPGVSGPRGIDRIGEGLPGSTGPTVGPEDRGGGREPRAHSQPLPKLGARRVIYQPSIDYPAWAERDRVQASSQYDIIVSPDGRVSSVRLASSSGYTDLDRLAGENVRRWIFEKRDGQAESRRATVQFRLNSEL